MQRCANVHILDDAIVHILEGHEPIVFKTRDMPRLAPHRQWDLDITDFPFALPVAGRHYPATTLA